MDLLRGQTLDLQRTQLLALVSHEDVKRLAVGQLREGGPQDVQEVGLLQTPGTRQLPDRTFPEHWSRGRMFGSGLVCDKSAVLSTASD